MLYTNEEKTAMMKTARSSGAVGANAILPRIFKSLCRRHKHWHALDYGSGPNAIHTEALRREGYQVLAYDINDINIVSNINNKQRSLYEWFDVVFASNVINVQPSAHHVHGVICELSNFVKCGGTVLINYPSSPRKCDLTVSDIDSILRREFVKVDRIRYHSGVKISTPVWQCEKG
jgi:hypothetical protein